MDSAEPIAAPPVGEARLPAVLDVKEAAEGISAAFAFRPESLDSSLRSQNLSEKMKDALQLLGANAQDQDAAIKDSYLLSAKNLPDTKAWLLSSVEAVVSEQRQQSVDLQILIGEERSNGGWTFDELEKAYAKIGIPDGSFASSANYSTSVISELYTAKVQQAQQADVVAASEFDDLKQALRTIVSAKGSPPDLVQLLESHAGLSLPQAYERLQVPEETTDESLAMMFNFRCEEAAGQVDQFRQALYTIGVARQSKALVQLAQGQGSDANDPWAIGADASLPAGLNNIGNTCYLNSVLQYFFSIREVRDRVLEYAQKAGDWQPPQVLKRIGGRQVTAREVERSHKCE